jgi:hypothetical protein
VWHVLLSFVTRMIICGWYYHPDNTCETW